MLSNNRSSPWKWAVIVVALLVVLGLVVAFFLGGALGFSNKSATPGSSSGAAVGPSSQVQPDPSRNADLAAILPAKPLPGNLSLSGPAVLNATEQTAVTSAYQALNADPAVCKSLLPANPGMFLIPAAPGQALYRVNGAGLEDATARILSGTISEYTDIPTAAAQFELLKTALPQCGQNVSVSASQGYKAVDAVVPLTVDTAGVDAACYNIKATVSAGGVSNNSLICHLLRKNILITVLESSNGAEPAADVLAQWTSVVQAQAAALAKLPAQ